MGRVTGNKYRCFEGTGRRLIFVYRFISQSKMFPKPFFFALILLTMSAPTQAQTQSTSETPLRFGSVRPHGWIRQQMQRDLDEMLVPLPKRAPDLFAEDIYDRERLHGQSRSRNLGNLKEGDVEGEEQYKWWNSETQSNTWDALIRHAHLLDDRAVLTNVGTYVLQKRKSQDPDGYLGIYTPETRYRFQGENGELWAKTTLLRGLLAHYEASGDSGVLEMVVRAVDNVLTSYPIHQSSPFSGGTGFNAGVSHGLTFTDVLDRLHVLTGDPRYPAYAAFLYADYSRTHQSECDAQLPNLLNPHYINRSHGVHTYEQIRPLLVARYARPDQPELAQALQTYLRRIQASLTPSGGPLGDEWIGGRAPDADLTGYEYCSLHELLDSYALLLQKTGDSRWAEAVEHTYFNAALGARHPKHSAIAYLKTDNSYSMTGTRNGLVEPDRKQTRYKYSSVHQDVAVCCVPNAGRITPCYLSHAWMRTGPDTLTAFLLGPSVLHTQINGTPVRVVNETAYPYEHTVRLGVRVEKPASFCLRVRIPEWATGVQSPFPYTKSDGFVVIRRLWAEEVEVVIQFDAEPATLTDSKGDVYFRYGALLYALPLEGRELRGKEYPGGCYDRHYESIDGNSGLVTAPYLFAGGLPKVVNGGLAVPLRRAGTDLGEVKQLIPLSRTVLRQLTFPRLNR